MSNPTTKPEPHEFELWASAFGAPFDPCARCFNSSGLYVGKNHPIHRTPSGTEADEQAATVDEILRLSLCQNAECVFDREQLQIARELLGVAFSYCKFSSTIKDRTLHRRIQDFLAPKRERVHADYCGLAVDHEGDCVAVVTRLLGV